MEVKLGYAEMIIGAMVGIMRHINALKEKRKQKNNAPDDECWQRDVEGALGEQAVAKAAGMYWSGAIGSVNTADVGHLQVRTTGKPHHRLWIYKSDKDHEWFVFVVGLEGIYEIRGMMKAGDAKQERFWEVHRENGGCYFVDNAELLPFDPSMGKDDDRLF